MSPKAAPQVRDVVTPFPTSAPAVPAVPCGLDDPEWWDEKIVEFDLYEESRDYGDDEVNCE